MALGASRPVCEHVIGREKPGGSRRTSWKNLETHRVSRSIRTVTRPILWRQPGEEILASVHDESLGGLGLILDDASGFELGTEATIVFASHFFEGTVRHIESRADGTYLVGFSCKSIAG